MKSLVILATGIGLGGSAAATYRAHRKPMSPEWDEPVGDTRFRRSDLPIGGAVAMALAFGSLVTGHRKAAAVLAGAGLGATAGSLGVAVMEPLADKEPPLDDSAADPAADLPRPPPKPKSRANGAASGDASTGEALGAAVLTPGTVMSSDLSGAASATLADADDALGGLSTDTADGLAAEAQAKASLWEPEPESDQALDPGAVDEQPSASASDSARPPSATSDNDDDDQAEQQLEEAAEAVEHQASFGSPALDDVAPESVDEPVSEPDVTGSAPQEGQPPVPDTWFRDVNGKDA
jgi:hypothetical protein